MKKLVWITVLVSMLVVLNQSAAFASKWVPNDQGGGAGWVNPYSAARALSARSTVVNRVPQTRVLDVTRYQSNWYRYAKDYLGDKWVPLKGPTQYRGRVTVRMAK